MTTNRINQYCLDAHVAEIYDQHETQVNDVALLSKLIRNRGSLRILEPFCGTGRILIPLACDGHEIVGMDQSRPMLDRARTKIKELPVQTQKRITLIEADVTQVSWPHDFDLVILGGNCLYELASPEEQDGCIASAAAVLRPGGYLYLDNDHMEGELDESWRRQGRHRTGFPSGVCGDGTKLEPFRETIWFDGPKRLWRCRQTLKVTHPNGSISEKSYIQQKHPPSTGEMRGWLEKHGFVIEQLFGDKNGNPYTEASPRAVFWAKILEEI